jgi:RNA polymerase sigma-70 factor (ECF subfamily)
LLDAAVSDNGQGLVTRSYLFTAARNHAVSYLRRERLHARWVEHAKRREAGTVSGVAPLDRDLEYAQLCERVAAEIARLPERCRLIFVMHRQQDLSYAEIARLLGISVKAVEAQMGRALRALRRTVLPLLTSSMVLLLLAESQF